MKKIAPVILLIAFASAACEDLFLAEEPVNDPLTNFEIFWESFDRQYSFFELKNVDWDSLRNVFRAKINPRTSPYQLFEILSELTLLLKDGHVSITSQYGTSYYDFTQGYPANTAAFAGNYLVEYRRLVPGVIETGRIKGENIGYVRIFTFSGKSDSYMNVDAIVEMFGATDAIIIDVRSNGGGSDTNSRIVASRFHVDERKFYNVKYKIGDGRGDFTDWIPFHIQPDGPKQFTKRVAVLTNRGCFSACEEFVEMMRARSNTILVGGTTGGGSGNPVHQELPNGWTYRLSTWIAADSGKHIYEGVGILPDYPVDITQGDSLARRDAILEKAILELR